MDFFEIRFTDAENPADWHYASVEGVGMCDREYVVRAVLRDEFFPLGESPVTPLQYTDLFNLVAVPHGNSWTEPEAFEVEPDWDLLELPPGNNFAYNTHCIGEVELRPTDLTDSQYDWDFWGDRPTTPRKLYRDYWELHKTTTELADEYGVSEWTVRQWMDRVGIERRDSTQHLNTGSRDEETDVYLSRTSDKYHLSSSCAAGLNPTKVRESEARNEGYTPCGVCVN